MVSLPSTAPSAQPLLRVSGKILWLNIHRLFCLCWQPFFTDCLGKRSDVKEGEAMTNFESISNEEIKNEDPENLVWTRFVCLSSMDNSQLDDLASEVREQAEDVRSPFEVFISGMKSVNHIVCLPFSLTVIKKLEVARQTLSGAMDRDGTPLPVQPALQTEK